MDPSQSTRSTHAQGAVVLASQPPVGEKFEFRFVEPSNNEERKSSRAGIAKAHHKKSRNGCLRCRARRVKCDEVHPVCGNCTRHQTDCVYEQVISTSARNPSVLSAGSGQSKSTDNNLQLSADVEYTERTESSTRRLLELKLMHTYNTNTCHTIFFDGDPVASDICIHQAPNLALTNDALLYSLLSFTASHLAHLDPSNAVEMTITHHNYWSMALEGHKSDLKSLGPHNFDATCVTSMFVRLNAFVILRDRSLTPYTPPTEWFQTTRGAMQVFSASYTWFDGSRGSATSQLVRRMPFCFDEEAKFGVSNRRDFLHLLTRIGDNVMEDMPVEDKEAFESTLSYIGGVWSLAQSENSNPSEVCRRLIILPYLVHARFAEMITEAHPRVLVLLAHYFAIMSRYRDRWWFGCTGEREVHALAATLPDSWQELMRWPLDTINQHQSL